MILPDRKKILELVKLAVRLTKEGRTISHIGVNLCNRDTDYFYTLTHEGGSSSTTIRYDYDDDTVKK